MCIIPPLELENVYVNFKRRIWSTCVCCFGLCEEVSCHLFSPPRMTATQRVGDSVMFVLITNH